MPQVGRSAQGSALPPDRRPQLPSAVWRRLARAPLTRASVSPLAAHFPRNYCHPPKPPHCTHFNNPAPAWAAVLYVRGSRHRPVYLPAKRIVRTTACRRRRSDCARLRRAKGHAACGKPRSAPTHTFGVRARRSPGHKVPLKRRYASRLAGRFAQPSGLLSTPEACAAATAGGGLTASHRHPSHPRR